MIDLTLGDACDRWSISRNALKARAARLAVELRRESSTRTVWPAEHVALGDELHEHLKHKGSTLANFPALPPPAASSDTRPMPSLQPPAAGSTISLERSLMAPAGGTDGLLALLAAMQPQPPAPPPADPLAIPEALARAAAAGHWITTAELASLLAVSASTVGRWSDGHEPRLGYRLQRRQARPGGPVWWRAITEGTD